MNSEDVDLISGQIIASAIEIHRALGPGLLESAYQACLLHELEYRNLHVEKEKVLPIVYKNLILDCAYRIDIVVENQIVVEVKSVKETGAIHEAQVLSYLKLSPYRLALLINFNVGILRNGIRRYKK